MECGKDTTRKDSNNGKFDVQIIVIKNVKYLIAKMFTLLINESFELVYFLMFWYLSELPMNVFNCILIQI